MSKAVEMKDGQISLFVETDDTVELPTHVQIVIPTPRKGGPGGMEQVVDLEKAERKFAEVKDLIVNCCNGLFDAVTNIQGKPEKFAIEFGIKLAGEAGFPILTKVSGEANFKVSIEWKKS